MTEEFEGSICKEMELYQHLVDRGMKPELYPSLTYSDDPSTTFLLYNLSGQLVGYQRYNPTITNKKSNGETTTRYFTYQKDKLAVFGLELLDPRKTDLFVVEGIFKAAVLHRLGFNAIAVLSATPKQLKEWFYLMGRTYRLLAIGDNDSAGRELVKIVGSGGISPVDLDEMTDEDIIEFTKSLLQR